MDKNLSNWCLMVGGTVQYSVTADCLGEEWGVPDMWNCIMHKVKCAKENVVS